MSMTNGTGGHTLADGVKALKASSGWVVAFGVIALVAGAIALGSVVMATESAVFIVGIMMLLGGAAEFVAAFNAKDWGHRLLWLLLGAMIVAKWPASSFYTLGIFLGIDLIFIGSGWLSIGLALRKKV